MWTIETRGFLVSSNDTKTWYVSLYQLTHIGLLQCKRTGKKWILHSDRTAQGRYWSLRYYVAVLHSVTNGGGLQYFTREPTVSLIAFISVVISVVLVKVLLRLKIICGCPGINDNLQLLWRLIKLWLIRPEWSHTVLVINLYCTLQ